MVTSLPLLRVRFFRLRSGREPVREWLKSLAADERKTIGDGLRTVQYGWPLGMPLVRHLGSGLWESHSQLPGKTARVLFVVSGGVAVLLHGFVKKTRGTPPRDLRLARERQSELK